MMLGRSPPLRIWHWMMSPGWVCWRKADIALYAVIKASRALIYSSDQSSDSIKCRDRFARRLTPSQGLAAA